jgi:hypothetical protein
LPDFAKINIHSFLDEDILDSIQQGYIKNIQKDEIGSLDAEVIYNLKIQEGSYREWP